MQLRHDGVEVRVLAVDVVDEHGARQAHALGFAPQFRGHDLGTCDGVHNEQRHFGGLHGGKRITDEVGMARSVKQVDLVVMVRNGRDGRAQGELAANLFLIVVKVGFAVVGGAHARRAARDVQHCLGERGFAGTILTHQHDVSDMFGSRSCHTITFPL